MAELDAVARLRFLAEGAKAVENAIAGIRDQGIDLDKTFDKLEKGMHDLSKEADRAKGSLEDAGKAARNSGGDADKATAEWDGLSKSIKDVQERTRKLAKENYTATPSAGSFANVPAQQMSKEQLQSYLGAYDAENASGVSTARKRLSEIEAEEKRISDLKQKSYEDQLQRIQKEDAAEKEAFHSRVAEQEKLLALAEKRADKGVAAASGYLAGQTNSRVSSAGAMSSWDKEFASALDDVNKKSEEFAAKSSPRLRYALYDVSTTALITAASITAVGVAVGVMAANYESAFTNVQRTLDGVSPAGVEALRKELIGLTEEIPLAFADVAGIATLGNQLGIASGDVASFTETVAKFSTVTGMTAEASAQAFGSLNELLPGVNGQYEKLGSAIALVGRKSVATEAEIVAMTTRLAASATKAGFTADQVVALSGAFASLRIAPERAQGVMEVYFSRLNTAIAEGGDSLNAFASIAGVAAGDVETLVSTDPVGFFTRLSEGIGRLDQVSQTTALQQLGLDGIRAGEVFGRVSGNLDVFNQALADSAQGWREGSELGSQYALVIDDLSSRWQIFMNAVQQAGAAVGAVLAPAILAVLNLLTGLFEGFARMADNPFGQALIIAAAAIAALIAGLSALIGVTALSLGSLLAIRLAVAEFGWAAAGATTGLRGFIGGLLGMTTATGGAALGLRVLRVALISTGIGAVVVLAGSLVAAFVDIGAAATELQQPLHFLIDVAGGVLDVFLGIAESFARAQSWIPVVGQSFTDLANTISNIRMAAGLFGVDKVHKELDNFVRDVNKSSAATKSAGTSTAEYEAEVQRLKDAYNATLPPAEAATASTVDYGNAAEDAAVKVRTLTDYASDLSSVFKRSFDIRFGGQSSLDGIQSAWNKIAQENDDSTKSINGYEKAINDAADAVLALQQKIRGLSADKATKQYWLQIATLYGDELRAAQLREEIASINGDIASSQKGVTTEQQKSADAAAAIAAEQEKLNRGLLGNSNAAIANRAALLGLVGGYQEYLSALAASGASQETLRSESERLKGEFIAQAVQMGYNREEIGQYAAAFDDMTTIINNVPRNITVDGNADPALQALAEFEARAAETVARVQQMASTPIEIPLVATGQASQGSRDALFTQWAALTQRQYGIGLAQSAAGYAEVRRNWERGVYGQFKDGGYTGNGGTSQAVGVVHGKEFVFSAPAVRNAGGPNAMANIHEMFKSGKGGFASAGPGNNGPMRLDPADIDAIGRANAHYARVISAGGIAKATAIANSSTNKQGSY